MAFGHPNLEVYSLRISFTGLEGNLTYKHCRERQRDRAAAISIQTSLHCCSAISEIHPLVCELQLIMLEI